MGFDRGYLVRYISLDTLQTTTRNIFEYCPLQGDVGTWPTNVQFHSPSL